MYCRLVDDISIVLQCEFSTVKRVIELMANHYPNMPLNVQVSFGYSRFLGSFTLSSVRIEVKKNPYENGQGNSRRISQNIHCWAANVGSVTAWECIECEIISF